MSSDERKWVGSHQKNIQDEKMLTGYHDNNVNSDNSSVTLPFSDFDSKSSSSLLDGEYDEKKNAESFRQALLEWRQMGNEINKNNSSPAKPGLFLVNLILSQLSSN